MSSVKEKIAGLLENIGIEHAGVRQILREYGHLTLSDYADTFHNNVAEPVQSREDLYQVLRDYATPLIGEQQMQQLENTLRKRPVLLTANHHGVDYAALCLQGTLIYMLASQQLYGQVAEGVIPIFAYASVPLNSPTFPRGILLSRRQRQNQGDHTALIKLNIFPDSQKRIMVSKAGTFNAEMVYRALKNVRKLGEQGEISEHENEVLQTLLNADYLHDDVLNKANYSDQSVLLNARVWQRLFAGDVRPHIPPVVYLEIERIVNLLLEKDLADNNTLAWRVLFDKSLRDRVIHELNGQGGCWDINCLKPFLRAHEFIQENGALKKSTVFFWAANGQGRRVHLLLVEEDDQVWLKGVDDNNEEHRIACTPEAILQGISSGYLIPSLFMTFLVLAFARAYRCFGGPWQTTYLPAMQKGLVRALQQVHGYADWAEQIMTVPTGSMVAGMTTAVARYSGGINAAGAVELVATGGLNREKLDFIRSIKVEDAVPYFLLKHHPFWGWDKPENEITDYLNKQLLSLPL